MTTDLDRLWKHVDRKGFDSCWVWSGATSHNGYGQFRLRGQMRYAHRCVIELLNGFTIPADRFVCHTCDVRKCCNPAHLFIGTRKDNMDDMHRKGRWKPLRGESHGMAKLSASDVVAIRESYPANGYSALARDYGVTPQLVYQIVRRIAWRDVA